MINAHKLGVWSLAVSSDGKTIATGGSDKLVRLWDAITFKEIRSFEGHTKEVLAVAISADCKTLASGGADRAIRTWDVATGAEKQVWHGHELKVLSLAFSPDGKMLASGGTCTAAIPGFVQGSTHSDHVKLWDVESGKEIRLHAQHGTTVSFTPDGRGLAAAGYSIIGTPREIASPLVTRGSVAAIAPVTKDIPWVEMKGMGIAMALSADGRLMALAYGTQVHFLSGNQRALPPREMEQWRTSIWDTATGKEIMQVPEDNATAIAISPAGTKLATGTGNGNVKFWEIAPVGFAEKAAQLAATDLVKLWTDLADEDASQCHTALWALSAAGKPAVALLKEKLSPQKSVSGDQVKDLLVKLDSEKYAVREAAFRDLKVLGSAVEAELRQAAADAKSSKEVRQRLQKILESWEKRPATSDELRQMRALQVLERIATPEARAVLLQVAEGRRRLVDPASTPGREAPGISIIAVRGGTDILVCDRADRNVCATRRLSRDDSLARIAPL